MTSTTSKSYKPGSKEYEETTSTTSTTTMMSDEELERMNKFIFENRLKETTEGSWYVAVGIFFIFVMVAVIISIIWMRLV